MATSLGERPWCPYYIPVQAVLSRTAHQWTRRGAELGRYLAFRLFAAIFLHNRELEALNVVVFSCLQLKVRVSLIIMDQNHVVCH